MQLATLLAAALASIAASLPTSPATTTTSLAERDTVVTEACPAPVAGRTCQQVGQAVEHYQPDGDSIITSGKFIDIYLDEKNTANQIHCTQWESGKTPMYAFWLASGYKIDIFSDDICHVPIKTFDGISDRLFEMGNSPFKSFNAYKS